MAAQGDTDKDRTGDNQGVVGSWPIRFARSQPSNRPSTNRTACIFCDNFLQIYVLTHCKLKFQFNREEIKKF